MRAAAAFALVVLSSGPSPASAQLFPTTSTTAAPPTTEVPTSTTAPAETTTTTAPAATTAPPDQGEAEEPAPTTTAPPAETTTTFPIPAGDPAPADGEGTDGALEAKTGLLPWLVALSLGGLGVAALIVGQQAWATRPRKATPRPKRAA